MSTENQPTAPASLPKYLREGLSKQNLGRLTDAREYIDELIAWTQRSVEDDFLPEEAERADDERNAQAGGIVVKEKTTCSDETCRCMTEGEKYGPYLYRYYRKPDGTLTSALLN